MSSQEEEKTLRALVQQSDRAYASRDADRAAQLLNEAQKIAPQHPLVLNSAAMRALDAGYGPQAVELLQRALSGDDRNPAIWVNLAMAWRLLQRPDDEAQAIERALALEPRHLVALLNKASLTRRTKGARAAARIYANALKTIPPGAQLPESLRAGVMEAVETVRANAAELESHIEERIERARPGAPRSSRVDHAIGALLGKRHIYHPQPTELHVPMLPALEFFPREDFPWLAALEAETPAIREEFERVFAEDQNSLQPYISYPDGVPLDQWRELNRSRKWSAYFLWRDGKPVEANVARCPRTAALLAAAPLHDVPGHAPTAFFSILDAGAHIPAHTGVTNSRAIVHVPLVLPGACRFRVGSQTREWRMNEAWVFDDTIEHEAWNDSAYPRAILIFDVWNPFLTADERAMVRATVPAVAEFYGDASSASGGGI
ncbi:MAG: aspartyl/asparaginyl beta-hydroxylase domain-containing protein [Steroidobacteraceae bacterium]|nr:aspartyl/asparaginyl beta-hydroxylase domain-containing protein [Steroidobacteraceae bacterium]